MRRISNTENINWEKLFREQMNDYPEDNGKRISLLHENKFNQHLFEKQMSKRANLIRARGAILQGGLVGSLINKVLLNNTVKNAVNNNLEQAVEDIDAKISSQLGSAIPTEITKALQQLGQYYNVNKNAIDELAAMSGSPMMLDSRLLQLYYNPVSGSLDTDIRPELMMIGGGFLSGLKKVANKVANVVTKVADIPVLGTVLQSIPGVGTVTSAARTIANLTDSTDSNSSSSAQSNNINSAADSSTNTQTNNELQLNRIQQATEANVKASNAITQAQEQLDSASASSTAVDVARSIDSAIPLDMETVNQARAAKIKAAALAKNSAILGYALGGDPSSISAAADIVLASSAVPQQSAIASGLKTDTKYGVWNPSNSALVLNTGITATDITAALTIALDLAATYSASLNISSVEIDPADGTPSLLPVLGAEYVCEAVPALSSSGYYAQIRELIDKIIATAPKALSANILAQVENSDVATPTMLANWILIPIVLRAKKDGKTATPDELDLYQGFTALGSTVLRSATSSDLNAIRELYPYALATIYHTVLNGSLWTDELKSDTDALQAWLMTSTGMAALENYQQADQNERSVILARIPSQYRKLVKDLVEASDKEGETGVSKVLSSLGSYVQKTFDALF